MWHFEKELFKSFPSRSEFLLASTSLSLGQYFSGLLNTHTHNLHVHTHTYWYICTHTTPTHIQKQHVKKLAAFIRMTQALLQHCTGSSRVFVCFVCVFVQNKTCKVSFTMIQYCFHYSVSFPPPI